MHELGPDGGSAYPSAPPAPPPAAHGVTSSSSSHKLMEVGAQPAPSVRVTVPAGYLPAAGELQAGLAAISLLTSTSPMVSL